MFWKQNRQNVIRKEVSVFDTPVIRSGTLSAGEVALTFDDGPSQSCTDQILSILRDAGWNATFFPLGCQCAKFPKLAKQAAREGHTIGSHTWKHLDLPQQSLTIAREEIQKGVHAVAEVTGTKIPFFRFPYGKTNDALNQFVEDEELVSFFWDVDSRDWEIKDPELLFENIMQQIQRLDGGIVLLHDIHQVTVSVLPRLIQELNSMGMTPVQFVPAKHS